MQRFLFHFHFEYPTDRAEEISANLKKNPAFSGVSVTPTKEGMSVVAGTASMEMEVAPTQHEKYAFLTAAWNTE